jgi:hypothetical protein
MATYTSVDYWLDQPILELADWSALVAEEIEAQQKR